MAIPSSYKRVTTSTEYNDANGPDLTTYLFSPTAGQDFTLAGKADGDTVAIERLMSDFTVRVKNNELTLTGVKKTSSEGTVIKVSFDNTDPTTTNYLTFADGTVAVTFAPKAIGSMKGTWTFGDKKIGSSLNIEKALAKAQLTIDSSKTYKAAAEAAFGTTLTSETDAVTGNVFNAGLVYSPGGNDRVNSLQDEDVLTGRGTNPTLNVTVGNSNDNGSGLITPTLNGIQTINATMAHTDGTGLDLQDATGLLNVNVTRVSVAGADILNMQRTANNLSVANTQARADIALTYMTDELAGDADTVNLKLSRVNADDLVLGSNDSRAEQIETVNLTVDAASSINNLDLLSDGRSETGQTLNITANAALVIGPDYDGDGDVIEHNEGLAGGSFPGGISRISIQGSGNVTLGEVGGMTGFVLAGASATGNIAANISNAMRDSTASFATGSGNDTLIGEDDLNADLSTGDGADSVTIGEDIGASATVNLGAGNDTLLVGHEGTQNGVAVRYGMLHGSEAGGASVDTGAGNDTVILGDSGGWWGGVSIAEEAVLNTGDGDDTVILSGEILGDTIGELSEDSLGGELNTGAGNDVVTFNLRGQGDQGVLVQGLLNGGSGSNVLNITGNADATLAASDADNADRISGFGTLNLTSEQSLNDGYSWWWWSGSGNVDAINNVRAGSVAENDDNQETADYNVDVSEFTGLTAINIRNEAGVIAVNAVESTLMRRFAGDDATHNITSLQGGEAINVKTVEAGTGVGEARDIGGIDARVAGSTELADDTAADVTLNLSLASGATNDTATVTIDAIGIAGQLEGDAAINDIGTDNAFANLTLAVNGSSNRTVALGASAFAETLTLTSNAAAGTTLTLTGVEATTINAQTVAAHLNITTAADEGKTIRTGSGNDTVDLRSDTINGASSLAAADRDVIDLGTGTNRIIVDNDMRGTGGDADEVFDGLSHVQIVQMHGSLNATLDDDAQATGVTAIELRESGSLLDLDLGADFERALSVDMAAGTSINIDNDADVNLAVALSSTGATVDSAIALTDGGLGSVTVSIVVDNVGQMIGDTDTGASNDVIITNADSSSEIDTIRLLDSVQRSIVTGAAATAAGNITLTLGSAWAQSSDTMTVDASDINDDDRNANGDGDSTDNGSDFATAPRGDIGIAGEVGNDIDDTQTVTIDASLATYKVNITGSQVNDTIIGAFRADTINGQAGDDVIIGGLGGDSLTGGSGSDVFQFGTNDGTGVTSRSAQLDSNQIDGADTITDFVTGADHIEVSFSSVGNTVNLARFASVSSLGNGDASLQGTNSVRVAGDAFYSSSGQLVVDINGDGDVTAEDLYINSANTIAASDINYIVSGAATNDLMRGGQGVDQLWGRGGDDTFVVLGSLSTADINNYAAAGTGAAVGITGDVADVLSYSELLTARTASEVRAGDAFDGGAGSSDTIHAFGNADFSGATLNDIETLVVHSTVTLRTSQLSGTGGSGDTNFSGDIATIILSGNTAHEIILVDDNGDELTYIEQKAAFEAWLTTTGQQIYMTGAGANTTVTVGGETYTVAEFSAYMTGLSEVDPTNLGALAPSSALTAASYDEATDTLSFTVSNYSAAYTYDFTGKVQWDFDDNGGDVVLNVASISDMGSGRFDVLLTSAQAAAIEGDTQYGANGSADYLDLGSGYVTNSLGYSGGSASTQSITLGAISSGNFDVSANDQAVSATAADYVVEFYGTPSTTDRTGNVISDFDAGTGTGFDKLDFSAFSSWLSGGLETGDVAFSGAIDSYNFETSGNSGNVGTQDINGKLVIVQTANNLHTTDTVVVDMFVDNGGGNSDDQLFTLATNGKAFMLTGDGDQAGTLYLWYIENDGTAAVAASEVALVGTITLTGTDTVNSFDTSNFIFA